MTTAEMELERVYTSLKKPTEDVYANAELKHDKKADHQGALRPVATVNKNALLVKLLVFFCVLLVGIIIFLAAYNYKGYRVMGVAFDKNYKEEQLQNNTLQEMYTKLEQNYAELSSRVTALDKHCQVRNTSAQVCVGKTCFVCPESWQLFNSKCYFLPVDELAWIASRDLCISMGGHLAIIESMDEQKFLLERIRVRAAEDISYWIGLTDLVTENHFLWVDNKPLDPKKSFWGRHLIKDGLEPDNWNNNGKNPEGEDCVKLHINIKYHGWYDQNCKDRKKMICETNAGVLNI
ncbi:CD209 antigen-like protein E [Erpetoichthys calabaricus]|nr:CD209 antigen-like protein E [Erpetoichthys calabaricus]